MRRVISSVGSILPEGFRRSLLGSESAPSSVANVVHAVLNKLPGKRVTCLPCRGVLTGYSMKIDWKRHRSFIYGTWETAVVNALADVVHSGDCVVDVGAHIGFYTLVLSKLVGPRGRVLAFEPLLWNFSVLCDNIRLNNCNHVTAINKGVLDHPCRLDAKVPPGELLPGSVPFSVSDGNAPATADAVSLDDFLHDSWLPVNFLKVDVEGAESVVLKGASRTIESYHPALVVEIHHFDGAPDASPVIPQLREWGYRIRWLSRWELTSHLLAT
jgi:FkbM family methyltransferase